MIVSVLINNYNYGEFLEQSIESVLAQSCENIEIVVVDDGSSDNSVEVIKKYEHSIKTIYKENAGQASAFNAGFSISTGDIVCFLDADDFFYPEKISKIVDTFSKYSEIGWVFHELDYVDSIGSEISEKRPSALEKPKFIDFRKTLKAGTPPKDFIPCGLCFRREVIEKILPMPESNGVSISDNYIKYAAIGLSPGLLLDEKLAAQRIHDRNTYTFRHDNYRLRAEIHVKTGFYLQQRFPDIGLFADKLFVRGVAEILSSFNFKDIVTMQEVKAHVEKNFNIRFLLINIPKCIYHVFRFSFLRLKDLLFRANY